MVQLIFKEDTIRKDGSLVSRQVRKTKMDFDQILRFMNFQTGLPESDLRTFFTTFTTALAVYLPLGSPIQTPMGTFSLGLSQKGAASAGSSNTGLVAERKATTDNLTVRLRPDNGLVARLKAAVAVEVVDTPVVQGPVVFGSENVENPGVLNAGKSGQIIHIKGNRLSFSAADPETGVFFVSTGEDTATRATVYSRIGTNFIDCKIPALTPGSYSLEVRTKPTKKTVRLGELQGGGFIVS
jgi:Domain of unknown function (DUF4469) with IG-like fold